MIPDRNREEDSAMAAEITPEYQAWRAMKRRCFSPGCHQYPRYGGRGISICDRWLESFTRFLDDMGRRPSDEHSLDRVDNNGNYTPENCRWATHSSQNRNKSNAKVWIVNGLEFQTCHEASERMGVNAATIYRWCCGYSRSGRIVPPKQGCGFYYRDEVKT